MATVDIRRINGGPSLVVESAERLALDFFRTDPSAAPGGYDDRAGRGELERITTADIVAINATMRARSPHSVWEPLISAGRRPWLAALDPAWDLMELDDAIWDRDAKQAISKALGATVASGRGLSVATKVLHLKRPRLFPVLDRLVLEQLGVTDSVSPMTIVAHLRSEGRRNLKALRSIQSSVSPEYQRSLVRILDVLLWASHPAAGLANSLTGWQHVVRRTTKG